MEKYYIAYGSNLNKHQMGTRCPSAEAVGTAVIDGWRLLYRRSYLTIEQKTGRHVPVGIWRVDEESEKALDRYEGFPHFYIKREFLLNVKMEDGTYRKLPCFAYTMNNGFPLELPRPGYRYVVDEGYRDFGLDRAILNKAYEDTVEGIRRKRKNSWEMEWFLR